MLIAQMTDIHIGFAPGEEPEELNHSRFRAALERLDEAPNRPDMLVLTGDITDQGDRESFAKTAALLAGCPFPVWPMVGNHDSREGLLHAFPQVRAAAGHSLGEFTAYHAAGAFDAPRGARLVRRRGELMHESGVKRAGTMAAILGDVEGGIEAMPEEHGNLCPGMSLREQLHERGAEGRDATVAGAEGGAHEQKCWWFGHERSQRELRPTCFIEPWESGASAFAEAMARRVSTAVQTLRACRGDGMVA
jgi:hypothetical protein